MNILNEVKFDELKVKQCLTLKEKMDFTENMVQGCIFINESGIYEVDYVIKEALYHILNAIYYAGFEVDLETDELSDVYDWGCLSGLFEHIEKSISKYELKNMSGIIENSIRGKITVLNSTKQMMAEVFEGIPTKEEIDKTIQSLVEEIGDKKQ